MTTRRDCLPCPLATHFTKIIQIGPLDRRKFPRVILESIEESLGGPERNVRAVVAHREEEWISFSLLQFANRPVRDSGIPEIRIRHIPTSPVEGLPISLRRFPVRGHAVEREDNLPSQAIPGEMTGVRRCLAGEFLAGIFHRLLREGTPALVHSEVFSKGLPPPGVKKFPRPASSVTGLRKSGAQKAGLGMATGQGTALVGPDPGHLWHPATENRCSRWIAGRGHTMGISKKNTPGSEPVHIGGECLWVPLETTDPVVKVIDRNEKNVWAPGTRSAHQNQSEKQ